MARAVFAKALGPSWFRRLTFIDRLDAFSVPRCPRIAAQSSSNVQRFHASCEARSS